MASTKKVSVEVPIADPMKGCCNVIATCGQRDFGDSHCNGAWRMSALGTMPCATGHRNGHQSLNIDWHILSYRGRVPGTK